LILTREESDAAWQPLRTKLSRNYDPDRSAGFYVSEARQANVLGRGAQRVLLTSTGRKQGAYNAHTNPVATLLKRFEQCDFLTVHRRGEFNGLR
jgi:hypothetical protein